MGRSKTPENIPSLKAIGLTPVKTVGNGMTRLPRPTATTRSEEAKRLTDDIGDCLFNALSDQLHGNDSKAAEYRATVVEYMRANKDDYTPFISFFVGGGTRRNPKRKTAGSLGGLYTNGAITSEQIDAAFETRMAEMAQGGTWGDNHEIVAFSRVFEVDINIWSEESNTWFRVEDPKGAGKDKPTLYLVHHVSASPLHISQP